MTFTLTGLELDRAQAFIVAQWATLPLKSPNSSTYPYVSTTFSFTGTSIGTVVKVTCTRHLNANESTTETLDCTDYERR